MSNKQSITAYCLKVRILTFNYLIKGGMIMEEVTMNESNIYYLSESPVRKAIAHLSIPMMVGI